MTEDTDSEFVQVATDVARRTLKGEYDLLLACRDLADLRGRLPGVSEEVMDTFVAVASEVDDLPLGRERGQWSVEALAAKDADAEIYRKRVRGAVEEALSKVLMSLGGSRSK